MNPQQPPQQQDNAAMPAWDAAQQQQQQQQPQVPPTFAFKAHHTLAVPQAPYGPYVAPMEANPPFQAPLTMDMHPMPTAHPSYNAPGPFRPSAGCQFPSIHVPPVTMVHREGYPPYSGYPQRLSHNFQTEPSLPNANPMFDRQIRNDCEFVTQHTLSEGRSASDLTREVERLPISRDNLRRLAAPNMDLERRIDETQSAADHHQDRAMRLGQNNGRRYRRSRSPAHRHHEYQRLPPDYPSPPGHDNRRRHFDNHRPPRPAWSSRGGRLPPPSSRRSAPPSHPPSSYQPTPTTSEPASSRQPSASTPSSVAPPAGQGSAPVAGRSPAVHGPEVAFDSADESDDDEFDDIKAYDAKKGKDRAFNVRNRATNKRIRETMQAMYAPLPLPSSAPRWLPARVPAVPPNPALDPPQVPGADRLAHMDIWPHPTDVGLADQWSDYVPLNKAQYRDLLRSARAYDSGAAQRVRDLIHQYDTNHELGAIGYLHTIKQDWRDPHRDRDLRPQPLPAHSSRH
ncbi:hypothetical protein LXA43DRAFT_1099497 [Ganoderma leucocontextum]|nr:hypothetical protein LXA43DRAFT_1099497 [Ganoderma leucocontextum]